MQISKPGSGSGGNATYIGSENGEILIDAGFSCKKKEERLSIILWDISDMNGILITHEHSDHIPGAGLISRQPNVSIYITPERSKAGECKSGEIAAGNLRLIANAKLVMNDSLLVMPFDAMHDACRTVGSRIGSRNGKVAAISTDMGCVSYVVRENFKVVAIMVIECNNDSYVRMNCHDPWDLKARVGSRDGHLSNNDAAMFITEMSNAKLKKVYLAPIGKDSHNPDVVRDTIAQELIGSRVRLECELAKQDSATGLFEL